MSFKNLEARYNENVQELYAPAKQKFKNGIQSNGVTDNPLIVTVPGKGYVQQAERVAGRLLPVSSTTQDVKRLTLFQRSPQGIRFLAAQQLLQTGNTYEQTRLINPLFVVANAVPYVHVRRHLRPLSGLLGKTDTSDDNVKKLGFLQVGTFNKAKEKFQTKPSKFWQEQGVRGGTGTRTSIFRKIFSEIVSATGLTAKKNIWDKLNYSTDKWKVTRPEVETIVPLVDAKNIEFQKRYHGTGSINFVAYFDTPKNSSSIKSTKIGESVVKEPTIPSKKLSYIRDDSNEAPIINVPNRLKNYENLSRDQDFKDPIVVSFAMGRDTPVRFRAYIRDLTQNMQPAYKDYQYIGRVEKFISYGGVQRDISFKLGIVALSDKELDIVWARINYLTGLVYPYGFWKGIMQPNITRLTIGNIFVDQPGYVDGMSTNFNQLSPSWDIDRDVPIAAEMDIKFKLIEQNTKVANSSFYGITSGFQNPLVPSTNR